jgi:hypothetical protein
MTTYSSAARLARLRDRHAGQRCVLVANGPSLNRMELGFLRGEITIGLNKIHLGLSRFGFSPRYLVAVNPKVLSQAFEAIRVLPCVKVLGQHAPAAGYRENALTYLVPPGPAGQAFSTDLAQGMHEGWTVTFAALQLAYHLGFAEVVLIGLDHRYQFSGAPNAASVMRGEDPNHFSSDYFGGGQTWDNPDLANSENSYRAALAEFNKAGRKIFDATLDGACTVFPKVDYRRHFALAE